MSLVCSDCLNYGCRLCFLLLLRHQGVFVLLSLKFSDSIKQLYDSLSCDNLEFPFVIFIVNGRYVSAHQSEAFFFSPFLSQFRLTFLFLGHLLGRTLVLSENGLFYFVVIYLPIQDACESACEGIFKDTATLIHRSPIEKFGLSRHSLIVRVSALILVFFISCKISIIKE